MKRIPGVILVLVLTLSLALAACQPKPAEPQTIQIGLQAPLTGDFAAEGQWAVQSVEVAKELLNKKGGVLGKQIEIIVADDASNPKDSALAAQKLISQGLKAVIASYGSSVTAPAADLYDANKVVSVGYGCTAVRLTMEKQRPYFFRTSGRDDTQSEFFAKFAVEVLGAKRIAIMHDNQDYGRGVAEDAKKFLQPYIDAGQVELVYYDAITPGESDYSAVVSQIKEINPDVWFFTAYYPEAALLLKQARQAGYTGLFVGNNSVPTPEFEKIAGIDVIKGSIHLNEPMPQFLNYPESIEFMEAYKAKYNELPGSIWAVYAADALNALAAAIQKAGALDPDAIAQTMRTMTDVKGITGPLMFTERGDRKNIPYYAYIYNDQGQLELYYPK
ncbi:MAG: branched-chain amino acid ABC transporter substrate-binding protein [Anaerolineales bacterium]|nr:branched-chain amino acid ABC transporter substrate-binding protein [Anaerolineales bacterium]MCS7247925.1 branched-chain amino acid ABC transporter substrate-binding protein [Anaerolineales bacterium]MDW8161735.1 branched-chain amino acid ABC transporter substrate-binding protein [Anaerolineales bacterium]MDW8445949.1 branched-chain amino acid ABC transporter substrate-binding protein [Anaerolineales bacterium]